MCCWLPNQANPAPGDKSFDPKGFQASAPAVKSTNANLWEAWHIQYEPLLGSTNSTNTTPFGGYDSADLVQAEYMFDRMTAAGISFLITDNTNGIGADFGNTWAATKAIAALAARYNIKHNSSSGSGGGNGNTMSFALSVGVNPLGSPTDPATLPKMEAQLQYVFDTFFNTTDAAVRAIDGNNGTDAASAAELAAAAYRDPTDGKPLVVLYVEQVFEPLWNAWMKRTPASVGNRFHVGYEDGMENWRPGLYGWMIDRSCAGPHSPATPCNEKAGVDIGIKRDKDVMYVSPAFAKLEPSNASTTAANSGASYYPSYAARDIGWYRSQFPVVGKECPRQLIVGAVNDYTENNGWWPSKCRYCQTGEENDPWLFWNATMEGIAAVRKACGGR